MAQQVTNTTQTATEDLDLDSLREALDDITLCEDIAAMTCGTYNGG